MLSFIKLGIKYAITNKPAATVVSYTQKIYTSLSSDAEKAAPEVYQNKTFLVKLRVIYTSDFRVYFRTMSVCVVSCLNIRVIICDFIQNIS